MPMTTVYPGYEPLYTILKLALDQAQEGKGDERHNQGSLDFTSQPIMSIPRLLGSDSGVFFQAIKKIQEAQRLPTPEAAMFEYLGAINYIAAGILLLQEKINKEIKK